MTRIGIVGAGSAAAAATFVLDTALKDAEITVLEKSGGVCGRAATRRHGDVTYDYGANYVKSEDERVADLLTDTLDSEGLVDIVEPIYTFDAAGEITPGRDPVGHRWSYKNGLTQIAKRLFARTDATVHRRTRVETIVRHDVDETWTLRDGDDRNWGPFDTILLNPPAPQTADLLADARWDHPAREALEDAVRKVPYRPVWTAILGYEFELDVPYYALINTDDEHEIGWVAREECKPGHVPTGESVLVVQAGPDWSRERYDDPPDENVAALTALTADLIGDDRLCDPAWTDNQGWRYALPDEGVRRGPLRRAESAGLYCAGDWVAGEARLHAALACGLAVGERMSYSL
ncbi:NAD/FAD-dependent oxidoreductase [Halalkaliarchaeum desulfuricum]|uniref:NAD/FAD-dependent oxidoreductase n=1 Tax=Halalkaliarchaeum desulfuricum TaxID=2055893 RepID=A0A343TME9_9EURY|nr:FAD-dependent oxidoreductase [Halalkaliarchaeum desulfuricum]AUX10271.1 NAD/FAD-dependent oxidoreductase [Halalkaliarchaeum desulfuricum]